MKHLSIKKLLLLAAVLCIALSCSACGEPANTEPTHYENTKYGLSFDIPGNYFEKDPATVGEGFTMAYGTKNGESVVSVQELNLPQTNYATTYALERGIADKFKESYKDFTITSETFMGKEHPMFSGVENNITLHVYIVSAEDLKSVAVVYFASKNPADLLY